MGVMCTLILLANIAYILNVAGVVSNEIISPFLDIFLILETFVPIPILFWLMFVTYNKNSLIVKYLLNGGANPKEKEEQQKEQQLDTTPKN
jgi:hypothetical protein